MPVRIQRRRAGGYRQPPSTRFCGRPSLFGNPFSLEEHGPDAVGLHAKWLAGDGPEQIRHRSRIYDRAAVLEGLPGLAAYEHLSCFCGIDEPCHVDTLLAMLAADI